MSRRGLRPFKDDADALRRADEAVGEAADPAPQPNAPAGGDADQLRGIPTTRSGAGGKVTSDAPLRVCPKCGKPPRGRRRCRCR